MTLRQLGRHAPPIKLSSPVDRLRSSIVERCARGSVTISASKHCGDDISA
jgi:hypothetical protein